ncbi:hypothetical protein ACFY4C_21080 [Actinomadura viridis]|uniref:hypothetical protein n=1 Tax=Actinomadura viridis TaxID=58110 RepID=UPI0036A4BB72
MQTIDMGTVRRRDKRGRFLPVFALTYETTRDGQDVKVVRRLPADGIELVGTTISRLADREQAWNIAVTNSAGDDVTFDFACFQG